MNIIKKNGKIIQIIPDTIHAKNCVFNDCEGLEFLFRVSPKGREG